MDSVKMVLIFAVVALVTVVGYQNHVLMQQDKTIQIFMQHPECGLLIPHSNGGIR
jgi:hypothetical protein